MSSLPHPQLAGNSSALQYSTAVQILNSGGEAAKQKSADEQDLPPASVSLQVMGLPDHSFPSVLGLLVMLIRTLMFQF